MTRKRRATRRDDGRNVEVRDAPIWGLGREEGDDERRSSNEAKELPLRQRRSLSSKPSGHPTNHRVLSPFTKPPTP